MATRSMYSNFGDVDEYLLALDENRRTSLMSLRQVIRKTVPQAVEMMRYNMPYYDYNGMLCAFTSQEKYLSFYIHDGIQVENFQDQLPGLAIHKGCIRFQEFTDFPEGVIERILAEAMKANQPR